MLVDYGTLDRPFQVSGRPASSAPRNPGDPSRVVELTALYALVQSQGLALLPGLIAYRSAGNTPHGAKIGSYSYTIGSNRPFVLAVLSVDDPQYVDVLMTLNGKNGLAWRLAQGQLVGDTLEVDSSDGGTHFSFKWSGPDSGTASLRPPSTRSGGAPQIQSGKFSRIG